MKDIVSPGISTFLDQGLSSEYVRIVDVQYGMIWKDSIPILKSCNIRLSGNEDELVWIYSKTCKYTPKEGYSRLIKEREDQELIWWWKEF